MLNVNSETLIQYKEYGLTEEYAELYEKQGGKCALCGTYKEQLVIDHDHTTGFIRGLLCTHCNWGLGHFKDNPELLRKASIYVSDFNIDADTFSLLNGIPVKAEEPTDWRKLRPQLTAEDVEKLSTLDADEMKKLATKHGVSYKTVSNWRQNARKELGK